MSLRSAVLPLRALAHETRWRIVELLIRREMSVGHLSAAMQLPQSSVSEHLSVMRNAGVLEASRLGRQTSYQIADRFHEFIPLLRQVLRISDSTDPRLGADAWTAARRD